jgi:hypothetical protein
MSNEGKIKRTYSTSLGNKNLLSQQKKQCVIAGKPIVCNKAAPVVSDVDVIDDVFELSNCCAFGGRHNCIRKHFMQADKDGRTAVDSNAAVEFVKECRKRLLYKNEEKKRDYVRELFRSCISEEVLCSNGGKKFVMDYRIQDVSLCKKGFACCLGISVKHLERASYNCKEYELGRINMKKVRKWTDATIQPFTYDQVESVMAANLRTTTVGKKLKSF